MSTPVESPRVPAESLPRMTEEHVRFAEQGFRDEHRHDVSGADLILAAEIRDVLRALASGSVVPVPRERLALLEREADRLGILDALIRDDRLVVDNNQLPPISLYLQNDNKPMNFYSIGDAGEAALVEDYPGKPVRVAGGEQNV